jgi:hypothetical protein
MGNLPNSGGNRGTYVWSQISRARRLHQPATLREIRGPSLTSTSHLPSRRWQSLFQTDPSYCVSNPVSMISAQHPVAELAPAKTHMHVHTGQSYDTYQSTRVLRVPSTEAQAKAHVLKLTHIFLRPVCLCQGTVRIRRHREPSAISDEGDSGLNYGLADRNMCCVNV